MSGGYYNESDLTPSDVLFGRGPRFQRYPGNVSLRAHIATRKTEYLDAGYDNEIKQRIAAQVIQHVREGRSPPGRFLRRLDKAQVVALGHDEKTELWTEADEKTVKEKTKQMLRERPTGDGSGRPTSNKRRSSDNTNAAVPALSTIGAGNETFAQANVGGNAASGGMNRAQTQQAPANANFPQSTSAGEKFMQDYSIQQQYRGHVSASDSESTTAPSNSFPDAASVGRSASAMSSDSSTTRRTIQTLGSTIDRLQLQGNSPGSEMDEIAEENALAEQNLAGVQAAAAGEAAVSALPASRYAMGGTSNSDPLLHESFDDEFDVEDLLNSQVEGNGERSDSALIHQILQDMPVGAALDEERSDTPENKATNSNLQENPGMFEPINIFPDDGQADQGDAVAMPSMNNTCGGHSAQEHDDLISQVRLALSVVKAIKNKHQVSDDTEKQDLHRLGTLLRQRFVGATGQGGADDRETRRTLESSGASYDDDKTSQKRSKRREASRGSKHGLLGGTRLPVSLQILIASLIDAIEDEETAPDQYKTVSDVEEDLNLMLSDPARYLYGAPPERLTGRLSLPEGKLYGHDEHFKTLHYTFEATLVNNHNRQMAMVCGDSGTGKSSLVEKLQVPLAEQNGRMIWCKFDAMDQSQSMSLIFRAFNEYCENLLVGESLPLLVNIRTKLRSSLGAHVSVLTDLLPGLKSVYGPMADSSSVDNVGDFTGRNMLERFLHYFRAFVRTIATPAHPVILVLDDLQWADRGAIELISSIVRDVGIRSLFCVGTYRDGDVDISHPLTFEMTSLISSGVDIVTINLGDLDKNSTNELVSDALFLPPRLTRSLASVIHVRTGGNALFVIEFLSALVSDGLLQYSGSSRRWEWDLEEIKGQVIAGNTIALMTAKMEKLPHRLKWLLRVASCFGGEFRASTMKLLDSQGDTMALNGVEGGGTNTSVAGGSTLNAFEFLADEEFIIDAGTTYRFAHDSIQEAAYEMTAEGERNLFHLTIGRILLRSRQNIDHDSVHEVVGQLNRGLDLLEDDKERLLVAKLNLMAAEKSSSLGGFAEGTFYALTGTTVLRDSDWTSQYTLCLRLFTLCSELMYVIGQYHEAIAASRRVIEKALSFEDKIATCMTLIQSLGGSNKLKDAITHGLEFLELLGESFPPSITHDDVVREFNKTKSFLNHYLETLDGRDITSHSRILKNSNKITALRVLMYLLRYAFVVDADFVGMMNIRLMQITLSHGICAESSFAFAAFTTPCCNFQEFDLAATCARIAKALLRKSGDIYYSNVIHSLYISISTFKEPLQACCDQLRQGFEAGLGIGNIEFALFCLSHHSNLCILAPKRGGTLQDAVAMMENASVELKQYKHRLLLFSSPYLQAGLILLGGTGEDPTILGGDAANQKQLIEDATERKLIFVSLSIHSCRIWMMYLFRRYDDVEETIVLLLESKNAAPYLLAPEKISMYLYLGLMAIHQARTRKSLPDGRSDYYRATATDAFGEMRSMAAIGCNWNFSNKVHLMTAELAYCDGDNATASRSYDLAISSAETHGFVHEEALAAERAGLFYAQTSAWALAVPYFEKAKSIWEKWGARAKVEDLTVLLQQRSNGGGHSPPSSSSQKPSTLDEESNASPFGSVAGGSMKI